MDCLGRKPTVKGAVVLDNHEFFIFMNAILNTIKDDARDSEDAEGAVEWLVELHKEEYYCSAMHALRALRN